MASVDAACVELGVPRRTLYDRIKRLGKSGKSPAQEKNWNLNT